MKKSFVLLLFLVLLVSGTGYYAQTNLLKEKDQVQFTENVIYGDKAVVDGVTIQMNNQYQNSLFWQSTYIIGEQPKVSTDYEFYPWDHYDDEYYSGGSLNLIQDYENYMVDYEDAEKTYYGLNAAMKELYDQTQPGEEKAITIFLKDYVDYYSFAMDLQLPEEPRKETTPYYDYSYMEKSELKEEIARLESTNANKSELARLKKCLEDLETFQEFFKIPVIETEAYTLAMAKDANGNVIGTADSYWGGGSGSGTIDIPGSPDIEGLDHFSLGMYSLFDDGDCYLTFDPYTSNGNLVDVSLVPGGYGLYHFTYDSEKGTIDLEQLKMVYPIDTSAQIEKLLMDESGKNLLLFTYEAERLYMSVIDRETMTLVDKFDIASNERGASVWTYEDYMVLSSEELILFTLDENGRYSIKFKVDKDKMYKLIETEEYGRDIISYDNSFDWNGETLLISNYMYDGQMRRSCAFFVAAVDETGLLYYGEYRSSLETADMTYSPCQPENDTDGAVTVNWD